MDKRDRKSHSYVRMYIQYVSALHTVRTFYIPLYIILVVPTYLLLYRTRDLLHGRRTNEGNGGAPVTVSYCTVLMSMYETTASMDYEGPM